MEGDVVSAPALFEQQFSVVFGETEVEMSTKQFYFFCGGLAAVLLRMFSTSGSGATGDL